MNRHEDPLNILADLGDEHLPIVMKRAEELCHELPGWMFQGNVQKLLIIASKIAVASVRFELAIDAIAYQEKLEVRS